MRILITGSRDWDDYETIQTALYDTAFGGPAHAGVVQTLPHYEVTIINGMCPTGADKMCYDWAEHGNILTERHPADWKQYGKRAGFVRNQEMVDSGADVCLAFIKNESKGASMTARIAEAAGIPTRRYTA